MKAASAMRIVARIAETQDGLVTTSQAVGASVPRLDLARLTESGGLERIAHGVYRVRGADADRLTDLRAAWLAADPTRTAAERAADLDHPIVVSHRSAAAVHGIGNLYADRHEMTAPVRKQSRRDDVVVHRAEVPRRDIVVARGMLVTTIERTLADLARTEPELGDVAGALADAYLRNDVDLERLEPMLDPAARRHSAHDGAELLQRMLQRRGLDAASALAELARQPELSRLLGASWASAMQSAVEAAWEAEAAFRSTTPSQALQGVLASSHVAEFERARLKAVEALEALVSAGMSPALREAMGASASLEAIARDLGRYDDVASLARLALAGVPAGFIEGVARDE